MAVLEAGLSADEKRVIDLTEELLKNFPPSKVSAVEFLGAQYDAGLAWVHFPVGLGGLGLSPKFQKLVNKSTLNLFIQID